MKNYLIKWSSKNQCYKYCNVENQPLDTEKYISKKRNIFIFPNFEKWVNQFINNQKISIPNEIYLLFNNCEKKDITLNHIKEVLKAYNKVEYYKCSSSIYLKLIYNKEFEFTKLHYTKLKFIFESIITHSIYPLNPRFLFINLLKLMDEQLLAESIPTLKTKEKNNDNYQYWTLIMNDVDLIDLNKKMKSLL